MSKVDLLSPIRDFRNCSRNQVRTARIVQLKKLSDQYHITPKKLCRRETMSRTSILRASKKLNEKNVEYPCKICDKRFYHLTTLEVHMHSHDDTLPRSARRTHSVHPRNSGLHMMDEGEQTKFFDRLSKELDDETKNEKKRKCKNCGKCYKRKTALKLHKLLRHS